MESQSKEKTPSSLTFTVRIQVEGRIQIPEPVRTVMKLNERDIVEIKLTKLEEKEDGVADSSS